MRKRGISIGSAVLLTMVMACFAYAGDSLQGMTIHICDDGAEWPPYMYYRRTARGEKTKEIEGFSVDVIREIFAPRDIQFSIDLLPWARCQAEVKDGTNYQMALNASYNLDRATQYALSSPYYSLTSNYFYSKTAHPDGLAINGIADIQKYQVCGLLGYNYETYGFPPHPIDQGARDFTALIKKIEVDRCDLFLEKYEILAGFTAIGEDFLGNPQMGYAPIPGMNRTEFYMLISKKWQNGDALKKNIDEGLAELEANGKLELLLKKYVP